MNPAKKPVPQIIVHDWEKTPEPERNTLDPEIVLDVRRSTAVLYEEDSDAWLAYSGETESLSG